MPVLSYGFAALSALLLLDGPFLGLGLAAALPWFAAPGAAFAGFLIGVVWYFEIRAKVKAKKRRTKALAAMCVNLGLCILAVGSLVLRLAGQLI